MKKLFVPVAALLATIPCLAQGAKLSDWKKLLEEGRGNQETVRRLCEGYVNSSIVAEKVEAEVCLYNVEMQEAFLARSLKIVYPEGLEKHLAPIYERALKHVSRAIELAPQELENHRSRLKTLKAANRYGEMAAVLDESCGLYRGKGVPEAWMSFPAEFDTAGQYQTELELMEVLDRHYPDRADLLIATGAVLARMQRGEEAAGWLDKAAAVGPNNAANAWNLGRQYDALGKNAPAGEWYEKSLALEKDPALRKFHSCGYAQFLEDRLHQRERACKIEEADCPARKRTACVAEAATPAPSK